MVVFSLKADLSHGRMSIIPEYDQNNVTILFSGHRIDDTQRTVFLFTVPLDVDSVSLIKSNAAGELDFVLIPTRLIKDRKWVEVAPELNEFAFMVNSTNFAKPGERYFEYDLSFSENIGEFNFEIQEPIPAENFNYSGFQGEKTKDAHGQTNHSIQWKNILGNETKLISISYLNSRGLTTRSALAELMVLSQQKTDSNQQPINMKIKRHRLYIWEPLLALLVVILFITFIIIIYQNGKTNSLNCHNCGQKRTRLDNFCSGCGENLNVSSLT
jgi:hypothetical protein